MPLPVLPARRTDADLLRLYCRTELLGSDPVAQITALQTGSALTNSDFPQVAAANRMLDAAIPPGWSAEQALAEVSAHFADHASRCQEWWLNPAQPNDALAAALLAAGHGGCPIHVLCLTSPGRPLDPPDPRGPAISVYSARAAFAQARTLAEEMAGCDQMLPNVTGSEIEAFLCRLDNAHFELLIAAADGEPLGMIGLFSAGDIGRIDPLFVRRAHRDRDIDRLLLDRAIELSARSRFADVLASPPDSAAYIAAGFRPVGELIVYRYTSR